jgi:hypothetical protein
MLSIRGSLRFAVALLMAVPVVPAVQAGTSNAIFAYSIGQTTELVLDTTLGQVTLSQSSRGWWNQTGFHGLTSDNYIAGVCGSSDICNGSDNDDRNFFMFDLSGTKGSVSSANLRLSNMNANGYISPNPSLTYTLYDVNSSLADVAASGSGRVDIYTDLGSGITYGARTMTAADSGFVIDIGLNANALAYINSNLGNNTVAFGGAVGAIPEPETYAMMLAGLGLLGWVSRHRKQEAA